MDPLCATETGLDRDLTEARVTAELRAARITVVAVSINGGLDDDPGAPRQTCAPGGSIGQAGRITAATGGFVVDAASAAEVPLRLAQAIGGRLVDVRPELVACDSGLSVVVTGLPERTAGGVAVAATVRVAVDGAAAPGTRTCVLDWLVGGRSLGSLFRQTLRVSTPLEDAVRPPPPGTPVLVVTPVVNYPGGGGDPHGAGRRFPPNVDVVVHLPGNGDVTVATGPDGSAEQVAVILRRDTLGVHTAIATFGGLHAEAELVIQRRFWEPPLPTG